MIWFRRILCAAPWLGVVLVFVWLVDKRIPLSGVRELSFPFDGRSVWFNPFLPGDRVTLVGPQSGGWIGQRIIKEPTYASLRLPGVYDHVRIGFSFRPHRQTLIDVGLRQEPDGGESFAIQPLWSEALASGWKYVRANELEGYVRNEDDSAALVQKDMDRVLVWHASTTAPLRMDYVGRPRTFKVSLRGSHDLQAIPLRGTIHFEVKLQNMNRRRERGTVIFSLSKNGALLWSDALSLAGTQDERPSEIYEKMIEIRDLEPGVYKLRLIADDDTFVREIRSPLAHWVLGPRLYFGDQVGYATTTLAGMAWTNAHHIVAETLHESGAQDIALGSRTVSLVRVHTPYALARGAQDQSGILKLDAPKGDVRLLGDGYFALAEDLLFLPAPRRLTDVSDLDAEGIRAVLTPYQQPSSEGDGWYTSSQEFAIQHRPGTLRLTIGAPGIESREGSIDIRRVYLLYQRAAFSFKGWCRALLREAVSAWRAL